MLTYVNKRTRNLLLFLFPLVFMTSKTHGGHKWQLTARGGWSTQSIPRGRAMYVCMCFFFMNEGAGFDSMAKVLVCHKPME